MMSIADTMTFEPERRCRDFSRIRQTCEPMRSHAPSLTPSRAGALDAECEFSPTTMLRAAALQSKSTRSLATYGARQLTVRQRGPLP